MASTAIYVVYSSANKKNKAPNGGRSLGCVSGRPVACTPFQLPPIFWDPFFPHRLHSTDESEEERNRAKWPVPVPLLHLSAPFRIEWPGHSIGLIICSRSADDCCDNLVKITLADYCFIYLFILETHRCRTSRTWRLFFQFEHFSHLKSVRFNSHLRNGRTPIGFASQFSSLF